MPQSTTQVFNSVLNALSDGVLRFALCVDIKTFICRIVIGDRIVISQQINIAGYLGASKVNEKGYYRKMFKQGGYPPVPLLATSLSGAYTVQTSLSK